MLNWRRRGIVIGWLGWCTIVLAAYYRQVWRLSALEPSAWLQDNYSLWVLRVNAARLVTGGSEAWQIPFWKEAAGRAGTAVFGFLILFLAAQCLGLGILRLLRWQAGDWRDRFLYRTALGLGTLSYLQLGMAGLGLYKVYYVRLVLAVILVAGAVWLVRQRASWRGWLTSSKQGFSSHQTANKSKLILQAIILSAMIIALIGALAPEIEYDALWYHLWLPKLWLQAGRPVDIVSEYISLYPLTWELLYGAGLAVGNVITAKLIHFFCLPLAGLLVYRMTQRWMPRANPWLAAALFVTVPTVLWEATTTYIDLALALYVGLVVYALLNYATTRKRHWVALAVLSMGLALAIKHLAIVVLIIVTAVSSIWLWQEERNWRRIVRWAVLFGGLSLLLPLPWYARSWLASGNPVFPDIFALFGAFPTERWSTITEQGLQHFKDGFGGARTWPQLLRLPWDMTIHAARYGGALGPLFFLVLPGLALHSEAKRPYTRWLLVFIILYIIFWASPISSFQMRFLIPLTPFLAVLSAEALARLLNDRPRQGQSAILQWGLVGLLLFNLPPFTSLHEGDRIIWDGWLTHVIHEIPFGVTLGQESEANYLARQVPAYQAWQFINTSLPNDVRILTFSGGDHFYSERDRLASDATMAHTAVWGTNKEQETEAWQQIKELGITHVLFNKRQLESGALDNLAIVQPSIMSSRFRSIYSDRRFVLYEIQ